MNNTSSHPKYIDKSFEQIYNNIKELNNYRIFLLEAIENEHNVAVTTEEILENAWSLGIDPDDMRDQMCDRAFANNLSFRQLSIRAFFILLYSRIEEGMISICESSLREICWYTKKKINRTYVLSYKDIGGFGYLDKTLIYLRKFVKCDPLTNGQEWKDIDLIKKLRNSLVHNNGIVNDNIQSCQKFKYHMKRKRIDLDERNGLIIDPEFMELSLEFTKKYFVELEDSLFAKSELQKYRESFKSIERVSKV